MNDTNPNWQGAFADIKLVRTRGRVVSSVGTVVEAEGVDAAVGDYVDILSAGRSRITAEVVGFRDHRLMLMPFSQTRGIKLHNAVESNGRRAELQLGSDILGRVINPFGEPIDGLGPLQTDSSVTLYPEPANPLLKNKISTQLLTGVRALDTFLPIGRGQRIGIFSGSGVGKSRLFCNLALSVQADIKVIALIGERGREVIELLSQLQRHQIQQQTVVVVATSEQPALERVHALYSATAVAEYFARQGKHVALLADSVTRHALAQREIGLAIGEPPTIGGYTPSVFTQLPMLVERGGVFNGGGSITSIFTVLVEGDEPDEPISDHMRSILDGHIMLSRELANQQVYPAIDVLNSRSRIMDDVTTKERRAKVTKLLQVLTDYDDIRDFIQLGGYRPGDNKDTDNKITRYQKLINWLCQQNSASPIEQQIQQVLRELEAAP